MVQMKRVRAPRSGDVLYLGKRSEALTHIRRTLRRLDERSPGPEPRWIVIDEQGEEFVVERIESRDAILRMAVHDDGSRQAWVVCH